ncbi:hypothetical protein, partial [Streptomyces calidiresistens]|uniref:hypothetical protein n=1 Tax=Streptomyces calidiresistens TaxID=1485586 RepID=UPI001E565E51
MTAPDHRPPPDTGNGGTGGPPADGSDAPDDAPGGSRGGAPGGPRGRAAELMAAVRAVESGERPADSFFTRPAP